MRHKQAVQSIFETGGLLSGLLAKHIAILRAVPWDLLSDGLMLELLGVHSGVFAGFGAQIVDRGELLVTSKP